MTVDDARTRFEQLARRELGAAHVQVLDAPPDTPDDARSVRVELASDRVVVARFDAPPKKRADLTRKLLLLVRAFEVALFRTPRAATPDPAAALAEELGALAGRAGAADAIVIDARSPIVWGSARGVVGKSAGAEVVTLRRTKRSADPPTARRRSERAVARIRALPAITTLARGGHLAYLERGPSAGILARSFATIYVIIVVFDSPIDELRAERALREHMPAVERHLLAMPPRDPVHGGNVVSLRARRARRG